MTTPGTIFQNSGPPISIQDQLNLLTQRGMAIPDLGMAASMLSHVNFYRLGGYWEPFIEPFIDQTISGNRHGFQAGATFDDVVERYNFDRELRALLLEAFNPIEVSIRTRWTYHLAYSQSGGSSSHLNPRLFSKAYQPLVLVSVRG